MKFFLLHAQWMNRYNLPLWFKVCMIVYPYPHTKLWYFKFNESFIQWACSSTWHFALRLTLAQSPLTRNNQNQPSSTLACLVYKVRSNQPPFKLEKHWTSHIHASMNTMVIYLWTLNFYFELKLKYQTLLNYFLYNN
jgi:hypothetical protein